MKNFFKKLQALPEQRKKMIFWTVLVIAGIILFVFFIKNTTERIKKLQSESDQSSISGLKENLDSLPQQDIGDAVKAIQEILKQNSDQQTQEANPESDTTQNEKENIEENQ